jgi:hypothetical protein
MDVGLDGAQQLRLEQQLTQIEPFDGIALEDLHDRCREIATDVAEPTHHTRLRPPETPCSLPPARAIPAFTVALVVQRSECCIDSSIVALQHAAIGHRSAGPVTSVTRGLVTARIRFVRGPIDRAFPEDQAPASSPLVLGHRGDHRHARRPFCSS